MRSVLATAAVDIEVIVVAGREMPPTVVDELAALGAAGQHRSTTTQAFNFSATVNLGAAHASGEHLLLLNDDTEAIAAGWLAAMLDARRAARASARSARGCCSRTARCSTPATRTAPRSTTSASGCRATPPGAAGMLSRRRAVAGVTAACMLTPSAVFDAVGGFTTLLPGNYNDVDYCMKLRIAGWSIVYEPAAVLYHFESAVARRRHPCPTRSS